MNAKSIFGNVWYWRLAIFECLTDAFTAGAMVWMAAVADKNWDEISWTARNIIKVSAAVAMLKVVKSFLSNTMTTLKDAKPIILKEGEQSVVQTHSSVSTPEKTVQQEIKTTTTENTPVKTD